MPQWFPIFPNAINNNTHTTQPHPFMTSSLIKVLIGQYFSTLASLINLHCTSCMCCCCCICCIFFVDTFLFWEDNFGFGTPCMISFHLCFSHSFLFTRGHKIREKVKIFPWRQILLRLKRLLHGDQGQNWIFHMLTMYGWKCHKLCRGQNIWVLWSQTGRFSSVFFRELKTLLNLSAWDRACWTY